MGCTKQLTEDYNLKITHTHKTEERNTDTSKCFLFAVFPVRNVKTLKKELLKSRQDLEDQNKSLIYQFAVYSEQKKVCRTF